MSASVQLTQCTQPTIVSDHERKNAPENAVDCSVVIPPLDDNKSSKLTNLSTELLADKEHDGSASGSHSEAILSGRSGDHNSPIGSLEGEASVFFNLINIYSSCLYTLILVPFDNAFSSLQKCDIGSLLEVSDGFLSEKTTVTGKNQALIFEAYTSCFFR